MIQSLRWLSQNQQNKQLFSSNKQKSNDAIRSSFKLPKNKTENSMRINNWLNRFDNKVEFILIISFHIQKPRWRSELVRSCARVYKIIKKFICFNYRIKSRQIHQREGVRLWWIENSMYFSSSNKRNNRIGLEFRYVVCGSGCWRSDRAYCASIERQNSNLITTDG